MGIDQGNKLKGEDGRDDRSDAEAESPELLTNFSAMFCPHSNAQGQVRLTTRKLNSKRPWRALREMNDEARARSAKPIAPTPMIYSTAIAWLVIRKAWKSSLITRGHSSVGPCVISFGQASVGSKANRMVRLEHWDTLCAMPGVPGPADPRVP